MKDDHLDLGKAPILSLLIKMSWPSIAAMVAMALYNLMDTLWLARISSQSIAALTITFPIQMIFVAIGIGTGVGAGSYAARMFGAGKDQFSQQAAGQVFLLALFFGGLLIAAILLYHDPILRFFGATEEILPLSRQYILIAVISTPFLLFMMMSNNLLRAEGRPNLSMYVILIFAVTGALLDPLLIFGWGPFPRMEIRGAAWAAVIAQLAGSLLSFYFLQLKSSKYELKREFLIPKPPIIAAIYQTGFPSVVMNLVITLVIIIYNHTLNPFGHLAIATLGLCFRINGLVMMVLFGIGHGVMPLVGFSQGAGLYERLMKTVREASKISIIFAGISTVLIEIFAQPLLGLFTEDAVLLSISVPALRTFVSLQVLTAPAIIWINMFIGLGKGTTSMILLLTRDMLFLIPMLLIFPHWFGLSGIWMAQPVSSGFAFFVILYWSRRELRKFSQRIAEARVG